jgi:hypothetical protein
MAISEPLDNLKETVREIRFFWDRPEVPPVPLEQAFSSQKGKGEVLATLRLSGETEPERMARAAGCQWEARSLNLEDLFINLTLQEGESL